jgi:hypothetical protein
MAYTQLKPRHTPGARVEEVSREVGHYRLFIPSGSSDSYRLAQLDDYTPFSRRRFPHRNGLKFSLLARTSSNSIAGTWGFGLWNDPFGLSLGFGGSPLRLPVLPNAVWFFGASEESYLSFREPADLNMRRNITAPAQPAMQDAANGFLAQTFRSPVFHPLLIPAGLALSFSRKATRRLLGKVIGEEGVALSVDPTQWRKYRIEWSLKRVVWHVDEVRMFESAVIPNSPLGLVIWIDNQYAAFTPEGKIGFGVLANPEPAWLEVKEIEVKSL